MIMEPTELLKNIDLDYWSNAKRDIVLILKKIGDVESVSELARVINRSFSVTHRHVTDLQAAKIVIYRKIESGHKMMISLYNPHDKIEDIFSHKIKKPQ